MEQKLLPKAIEYQVKWLSISVIIIIVRLNFSFVGEGAALVTKTTVTVGQDGQTHAESFIETFDVERDMTDKIKKSRKCFSQCVSWTYT